MNSKLIYKHNKPYFEIRTGPHQWTLKHKDNKSYSYHPNLSNLLDYLAEHQFRKNTNILKEISDLQKP